MKLEHLIPLRCKIDNEGYVTEAGRFWDDSDCICDYQDTVEAIKQAHRQGWEQAKREADILLLDLVDVVLESKLVVQSARRAIAAMEYKEKTND